MKVNFPSGTLKSPDILNRPGLWASTNLGARKYQGVIPPITAGSMREAAMKKPEKPFLAFGRVLKSYLPIAKSGKNCCSRIRNILMLYLPERAFFC
jgi:hypothetical protein